MSQDLSTNTETDREARRRERHDTPPWVMGGILIVIGVVLLLSNVTGLQINNWWALFILIPALASLANAWRLYQVQGRASEAVMGPFIGGVILLFVFAMFFFGFDWGRWWPVLLILAGAGALAGVVFRNNK